MNESRHVVMFQVGDRVNYIDPHDNRVGIVQEVKHYKFAGDFPYLKVRYPGHCTTGPIDAFTLVGRGQHVQKQVEH